ncbi:glycosyltransferase [Geitlerinema sp. PCC 7407]|uniref:glycosyltransferase n=1 Tax=Geitlerinema sp. PCC 7407 TaxID=1173025 RepID=UPI00029FB99F|nr:glycosyltransferase [Geitlerinema sp. PCC 7407]AFY66669.1 glycosyl transferase group 1 [Geitlerinema sp. PCC 7407]
MTKLLFVNPPPFFPDSSGGAQRSAMFLFEQLQQRGWQIEVLCGLSLRSPYFRRGALKALGQLRSPFGPFLDHDLGYPAWRQPTKFADEARWQQILDQRLDAFQPDAVLSQFQVHCPLLSRAAQRGFPSFYFARNLYLIDDTTVIPEAFHLIANAPHTAEGLARVTDRPIEVILPFVHPDRYRVSDHQRRYVTFINPVPEKGVDIALEVARQLPDQEFLFVKGKWSERRDDYLESLLAPARSLPNVTIWENQADMRTVYRVTRTLLAPSQFIETFGRVILEAQINGIPVVAAQRGGIPYTVGDGGFLADPYNDPAPYIEALRTLQDPQVYSDRAARALANAQRPEFDPQQQVERFIRTVTANLSASAPGRSPIPVSR